ncbi:MAG: FAD-dependent oxidoreductase [Desulfarculaceae bacterium]|jgi:2-enoate reductase
MGVSYSGLFQPGAIGKVRLKNRLVMAPMGTGGLTKDDGSLSQRCIDYYVERARGGVGLIISGCTRADNKVERIPIHIPPGPAALASYSELAEAVHAQGAKMFVQLTAGFGRVLGRGLVANIDEPLSASALPHFWRPDLTTRPLTTSEVKEIVHAFGRAAKVLADAGIDGVHLHGHEGYLFDQFASACWNKRTDKYGGSLASRLRFAIEALYSIKEATGNSFPVIYQYGLKHYITGEWPGPWQGILPGQNAPEAGRDVAEGQEALKRLEEAGFDAFHVDAGCYDSWYWAHPPGYQARGCMLDMAALAKQVVSVPVIAVGRLDDPALAESALAQGQADFISLGRAFLADPAWPRKVRQGDTADIRPCIGCQYCLQRMMEFGQPLCCAVNPMVGREEQMRIRPANRPAKILVAGGGVGGMEAARVAKLKGHEVVLYEKGPALGGHLLAAGMPAFKEDIVRLVDWYEEQMRRLEIPVKLNTELTVEMAESEGADAVILATGSRPVRPDIPGLSEENFISCIDVLLGLKKIGARAVVVGAGLVGCETALWLARQGKKVTILEIMPEMKTGAFWANDWMLRDMLKAEGVEIFTSTSIREIRPDGRLILSGAKEGEILACDSLVFAAGLTANDDPFAEFNQALPEVYNIGDSHKPRKIKDAIWEAFMVARDAGEPLT